MPEPKLEFYQLQTLSEFHMADLKIVGLPDATAEQNEQVSDRILSQFRQLSLLIVGVQYFICLLVNRAWSFYNDPFAYIEDVPRLNNSTNGFNKTDPVHKAFLEYQVRVKHPDGADGGVYANTFVVCWLLSILHTKDIMEAWYLAKLFSQFDRGFGRRVAAMFHCAMVWTLAYIQVHLAARVARSSDDLSTFLGTAVGLYLLCQLDDFFKELINALLPMVLIDDHDVSYPKAKMESRKAPRCNICCGMLVWFSVCTVGILAMFGVL